MTEMNRSSRQLLDLLYFGLDHGIDSVRGGGPLIPFLVREEDGVRSLLRIVAETLEESVERCRDAARELPRSVERYAIAYDGYLTVGGQRTDAIVVEGAERGRSCGVRMAQRYRPRRGLFRRLTTIGNAADLGNAENLLTEEIRW